MLGCVWALSGAATKRRWRRAAQGYWGRWSVVTGSDLLTSTRPLNLFRGIESLSVGSSAEPPCFFILNSRFDWGSHVSFSRHQLWILLKWWTPSSGRSWICKLAKCSLHNLSLHWDLHIGVEGVRSLTIVHLLILCDWILPLLTSSCPTGSSRKMPSSRFMVRGGDCC